jgi:hypothetical protein
VLGSLARGLKTKLYFRAAREPLAGWGVYSLKIPFLFRAQPADETKRARDETISGDRESIPKRVPITNPSTNKSGPGMAPD